MENVELIYMVDGNSSLTSGLICKGMLQVFLMSSKEKKNGTLTERKPLSIDIYHILFSTTVSRLQLSAIGMSDI